MDATVRFYEGVLGMRLVATLMAGPMRHYFFEIAPGNTVAFFEVHDAEAFAKPAGVPDRRRAAQFDHLSFNLQDDESLHALRRRLKAFGCEVTGIVDHGIIHSVYFMDNNGIALEASCWVNDATAAETDYADDRFFADSDPVPSVAEVALTPVTHLV
jgi:catechol 2,3-dioxygenase-like lactoylglutathione lyase family enzyme